MVCASKKSVFLTAAEVLHHRNLVSGAGLATYTFQVRDGSLFTLDIAPISQDKRIEWIDATDELPYYRQRPDEAFWFIR